MRAQVSQNQQTRFTITQTTDIEAQKQASLTWGLNDTHVIIKGSSDYSLINSLKNAVLLLKQDFFTTTGPQISIFGEKRDDLDRRLLLIEHELNRLLKRDILYNTKSSNGRTLDYTNLLNEKQNQIVELQKKIENLEQRLRKSGSSYGQLQNHIVYLTAQLKRKDDLIKSKNDALLAQIASKTQIKQLNFLLLENNKWASSISKSKAAIIGLFNQIQRVILNTNTNQEDIDNILETFLIGFEGSRLQTIVNSTLQINKLKTQLRTIQSKFSTAGGVWKSTIEKIKRGQQVNFENDLTPLLQQANVQISTIGGITQIQKVIDRTVQVPVQDARTKHLIHLLSLHMKKFVEKYPQLRFQLDTRLYEFFQQQIIDVIQVDELERLIEVVKYIPQVVRVENVYAYSSDKTRRVQFHLRVLIKALLQQLQKIKLKTGVFLQIDQGIIKMINEQIMQVIDVDDILKIFRVVPKIVQVEKIIQKVIERVVEVPQVIPVQKIVEKIIQVPRIQQIQRIVNVPIEVIKVVDNVIEKIVQVQRFVEKVVQVPRIIEKVIQKIVEIPKIVQVQKIVEKIVYQTEVVSVQKIVDRVVPQVRTVEIIVQKIIPIEKIIQKIVQVPTYIEKIVQKPIQVIKIIEVQKVVERLVKQTDYQIVKQNLLQVITEFKQVERIVEKVIVVEKIVEKIVEVPQIVEKIVQVTNEIIQVRQVEVIKEKLVPTIQIKQVERIINQVVPLIKQVEKIVDRRVQVPIIQERIVKVPQIINQIVIEHVQVPRIVEIERVVEKFITQTKLVEVEKPIIHYVKNTQVINSIVEKIIEVPRTVERIKQVRVNIEKIIEKMVEVPKVIEVEKIVQKIAIQPRVIEKIVQVPQIVEKIVERIIEIENIKYIQKIVQVPVITQKVIQIQVPKNVYIEVQKIVERIVQKVIPIQKVIQRVVNVSNQVQKIIQVNNEVARVVEVERIVPKIVETQKVIQIEKPTTLTVQVPVQIERIVQKVVPIDKIFQKIVQVPQLIEKVVQVHTDNTQVKQVQFVVQKVVYKPQIREIPTQQIVIQQKFTEIPTIIQKIIPVKQTLKQIIQIQQVLQKIVQRVVQIPKIVEVIKNVDKVIEVPKVVELEVIIPQLVKVNQIVQQLVEKIVHIPVIQQVIKQVQIVKEKIVQVHTDNTQIKQVEVVRDKVIQVPQVIEIAQTKNFIETNLQIVERFQQRQVPIYSTVEKFLEVPHVLQKIVQRIVILPQVVEVLKYVHQINESSSLVAVGIDVSVQEAKYKQIYGGLRSQFDILLTELRKLKTRQPDLSNVIIIIQKYLTEFDKLAAVQRIVRVDHDVIVQKQVPKPIVVPTKDSISIANQLSQALLIQKLVIQLKRITKQNSSIKLNLDEDTLLIFFSELYGGQSINISNNLKSSLQQYINNTLRKFTTIGGNWTTDHAFMLNTILQERFTMANLIKNANLEIEKVKSISDRRLQDLRKFKMISTSYQDKVKSLSSTLIQQSQLLKDNQLRTIIQTINNTLKDFKNIGGNDLAVTIYENQPIVYLGDVYGENESYARLQSLLRESQYTITALKDKLIKVGKSNSNLQFEDQSRTIQFLRLDLNKAIQQLSRIKNNATIETNSALNLVDWQIKLKTATSKIHDLQSQLRSIRLEYENKIRILNGQIEDLKSQLNSYSLRGSVNVSGNNLLSSQQSHSIYSSQQSQNLLSSQNQYQYTPSKSINLDQSFAVNQSPEQISKGEYGNYSNRNPSYNQSVSSSGSFNQQNSKIAASYGGQQINLGGGIGTRVSGVPVGSSFTSGSLSASQQSGVGLGSSISRNSLLNSQTSGFTASFGIGSIQNNQTNVFNNRDSSYQK